MKARIILFTCLLMFAFMANGQSNVPNSVTAPATAVARSLPSTPARASDYLRTLMPVIPLTDSSKVRFAAPVDSIGITTEYADGLGRPLETVVKQSSPLGKDYIAVNAYDDFGRPAVSYLPYVSTTNTGQFTSTPFKSDSVFYKGQFPNEQINYGVNIYDGSPLNRVVKTTAPGNSWAGAGVGTGYSWRANTVADSVRLWTININSDKDVPATTESYQAGALMVQETTNESGIKTLVYKDELGRTILSKQQISASVSTAAYTGWLCTYFVHDEMSHLRFVITPKATQALVSLSWNLSGNPAIVKNLCYAYYYDARGRLVTKGLPDKGKIYMAYDSIGRVVLAQDSLLRATSQWQYVKYDGQNRAIKAGLITLSGLSKDTVTARAARSFDYPTLTGTYSVLTEVYYDDYSWVSSSGSGLGSIVSTTDITSTNFITSYNASPYYAQPLTQSKRTRGVVTGIKTAVLGTSDFLYKVSFYDDHLRVIQTQATNFSSGTDVSTTEYNFTSQPLRNFVRHEKSGTNSQTHTLLTKYTYDHVGGRLTAISKKADGQTEKQIASYAYNELGQLKTQVMGDHLETQNFAYSIRGALTGINKNYATAATDTSWFGEELSYDYGFTQAKLDGNIAGIKWRSKGDGAQRAYGYTYDAAGRLAKADFTQNNSGWNTSAGVDYSVRNLNYDANGNIISMTQKGLKINSSPIIDSLVYGYAANSNQLLYVTDKANDTTAHLGDFTEINNNTTQDYWYDGNGNYTKDNNKGISAVTYNFLNLPQVITVTGKGTITYIYDATGTKLQKKITEGSKVITTTYINGFVYKNDTLQYALTEDGRIREKTGGVFVYDYFVKDHLGNVRMVLTEQQDTAFYPPASMETAQATTEEALYANVNTTRVDKPTGYPNDTYTNPNDKVAKVNGSGNKIGPSIILKVMAGDKFNIRVSSWYKKNGVNPGSPNSVAADLVTSLINSLTGVNSPAHGAITSTQLTNSGVMPTSVNDFLSTQPAPGTTKPKAYLNWVLLDEQFKFVQDGSSAEQVGNDQEFKTFTKSNLPVTKNGYLYVYVSNETPNIDVFFDNLQVTHIHGPLLQEDHYYPYGLGMAGISSSAVSGIIANTYKANGGTELGSNEWADGSGLELYETTYRSYNTQIGRFMQADPLMERTANLGGYVFGNDNPSGAVDPTGLRSMAAGPELLNFDVYGNGGGGGGGAGGGSGGFFSYMDGNGNKWHHADPLAGTASASQPYIEGYGWDGFGNSGNNGFVTDTKKETRNGVEGYYISYTGVGTPGDGHEHLPEVVIDRKFVAFDNNGDGTKDNPYNGSNVLLAAYMHYQGGSGTPFYINTDCLDFTGLGQDKFSYDKNNNISINLFDIHNITQTGLVIGKVGLKDEGNNWFSLKPDEYDFNMQKGAYARNFFTIVDWILHHPISPFMGKKFPLIFINPIYIRENAIPRDPPN